MIAASLSLSKAALVNMPFPPRPLHCPSGFHATLSRPALPVPFQAFGDVFGRGIDVELRTPAQMDSAAADSARALLAEFCHGEAQMRMSRLAG